MHIDTDGACSWAQHNAASEETSMNATKFNTSIVNMVAHYNIHIRDNGTMPGITYEFNLTRLSMARGIHVSFPNEAIYEPNVKQNLNNTLATVYLKEENHAHNETWLHQLQNTKF